jgi:hypothetical protein
MAKAYVLGLIVSITAERLLGCSFSESIHPEAILSIENDGAAAFKALLEDYLVINGISNGFAEGLEGKQLAFVIRMTSFPK